MRFEEAWGGWRSRRPTQEEAVRLLGVCERTFRRYVDRYEDEGLDGLLDKRLSQVSAQRASVDEAVRTETLYRERYPGWNVKHFHRFYRCEHAGERSYTWVKNTLPRAGLVAKAPGRGKHRRRLERAPVAGMMLHQDGSTHEWVAGQHWDLIVTLDDATSEHYSMFFVEEEGTASSFQAMAEVIEIHGLPSSLYTDRGSHYWIIPEAGGKVDRLHRTQFGRAMHPLGVERIPAYSPQARGRCERMFATHQERLPKELAARGIHTMQQAPAALSTLSRLSPTSSTGPTTSPREPDNPCDGAVAVDALGAPAPGHRTHCRPARRTSGAPVPKALRQGRNPPSPPAPAAPSLLEPHPSDFPQHLRPGYRAPPPRPSDRTDRVLLHRTDYLLPTGNSCECSGIEVV